MFEWEERIMEEKKAKDERLAKLKKRVFDNLRETCPDVTYIIVLYDGECDSGNINDVAFYVGDDRVTYERVLRAEDVVKEFAWMAITARHPGFEINEGGFGEIHINVPTGTVTIKHNERHYYTSYYEDEVT